MRLQNFSKQIGTSVMASIFLLMLGSGLVHAQDNQPSPLYEESLQKTLKEFESGTRSLNQGLRRNLNQNRIRNNELRVPNKADERQIPRGFRFPLRSSTPPPRRYGQEEREQTQPTLAIAGCVIDFPTMIGSTCSTTCGLRSGCLLRFPTLAGTTCSITCGLRSTCANVAICLILQASPCAMLDNLSLPAKGAEKLLTFNIF